jgi:omega-amidase
MAKENLLVKFIQTELYWENIEANLGMFEEAIYYADETADLVILPEMFNTGFTMNPAKVAEPMNSKTFRWMQQQAARHKSIMMGSYPVKEDKKYYNRLLWMQPDGGFATYDKKHLLRLSNEHEQYTPGKALLVKPVKGWKICPQICYDLRFPVWSRNRLLPDGSYLYDVLVYIANWPAKRIDHWNTLLKARAIENQCYVVGVNRIGTDGNGWNYTGQSAVYTPMGEEIFMHGSRSFTETVFLDGQLLDETREKLPFHLDADPFLLQ